MNYFNKIFIIVALSVSFLSLAFTEPKVGFEIITDAEGNYLIRYATPYGGEGILTETTHKIAPATDQEVLWMTEHPTAIAENDVITGNGSLIVTGWWLNEKRVSKYNVLGSGVPIWEYSINPNWKIPVSASDDGNVIAAVGDVTPLCVWLNGAGPNPSWQFAWPANYVGSWVNVSDNGSYITTICHQQPGDSARLIVFNANSATPLWQADVNAQSQSNGVEISEDNNWILVTTYYNFYVFNMLTATLFYTGTNYSQTMGGMDDDAEWIATGDFYGVLHVYQRSGTSYIQRWTNTLGGWVTAVDIDYNATTVFAGNYSYSPANHGMVRAFTIGGEVLWSYDQYGDYVASVALCNDGSLGVAGSWGQYGATYGDVFTAFDMATGEVIFRLLDDIDEPGSIFEVGISDEGGYAVAGGKAVHARQFGNGGEVYSIELGPQGPFNVTIDLIPDTLPIVIPPGGGSFGYTAQIHNNEGFAVTFDAWTMAQLPNGSNYGPIINRTVTLGAGGSLSRAMNQFVPASAPAGNYIYYGKVGVVPDMVWNQDSFPFSKSGATGNGLGNWYLMGWDASATQGGISLNGYHLSQNYPNPFNPTTTIEFSLPIASNVKLVIYNVLGKEIETLVSGWFQEGEHKVEFNAKNLPSGVYFYRLQAEGFEEMKKMVLIK